VSREEGHELTRLGHVQRKAEFQPSTNSRYVVALKHFQAH
jgi:hypothetical protein